MEIIINKVILFFFTRNNILVLGCLVLAVLGVVSIKHVAYSEIQDFRLEEVRRLPEYKKYNEIIENSPNLMEQDIWLIKTKSSNNIWGHENFHETISFLQELKKQPFLRYFQFFSYFPNDYTFKSEIHIDEKNKAQSKKDITSFLNSLQNRKIFKNESHLQSNTLLPLIVKINPSVGREEESNSFVTNFNRNSENITVYRYDDNIWIDSYRKFLSIDLSWIIPLSILFIIISLLFYFRTLKVLY